MDARFLHFDAYERKVHPSHARVPTEDAVWRSAMSLSQPSPETESGRDHAVVSRRASDSCLAAMSKC